MWKNFKCLFQKFKKNEKYKGLILIILNNIKNN